MIRDSKQLTHPDKAMAVLGSLRFEPEAEEVRIEKAQGRVLAEAVICPQDSPPFTKAAMDGYAVRSGDDTGTYRIIETVAAGDSGGVAVGPNECVKIMTGAVLPEGADKVIRVEYTREKDGMMSLTREEPFDNIIPKGSNHKMGETAMKPKLLTVRDIGVLASYGLDKVPVALRPKVTIIPTGTELQLPGKPLQPGQIYNSNSFQLEAQTRETGCSAQRIDIIGDDPDLLEEHIRKAVDASDVVLLSGGVSMGDYDFVPQVLHTLGAEILFHGLAVKPGKPTLFAVKGNTYIFGMPGNPVSTFVIFDVFVKPFLFNMMGIIYTPPCARGTLAETIKRKSAERVEFLPVRIESGIVRRLPYHGSSNLDALAEANALLRIEQNVYECPEGMETDVRLI